MRSFRQPTIQRVALFREDEEVDHIFIDRLDSRFHKDDAVLEEALSGARRSQGWDRLEVCWGALRLSCDAQGRRIY